MFIRSGNEKKAAESLVWAVDLMSKPRASGFPSHTEQRPLSAAGIARLIGGFDIIPNSFGSRERYQPLGK